jgi:DNA repair exonuclease SbcCD ATPase subunit
MTQALLRAQSIWFEGAGSYRNPSGELPLANQKRVLICGPEGSGKSMIPEIPTLILYGRGSPRVRKNGFTESTIANVDTGYLGKFHFESGFGAAARSVEIEQAFKHKRAGSRYVISIDGQRPDDDTPLNKLEQKRLVKRLAPLTLEEWLGVVYMHQGGMHDLLSGTTGERQKYLTTVFGLDFYMDLLTTLKDEQKDLVKRAESATFFQTRAASLDEEMREVNGLLRKLPPREEIEQGVSTLSQKLQGVSQDLGHLEATRNTIAKRSRIQGQYDAVMKAQKWKTVEDVAKAGESNKEKLRKAQADYARIEAAAEQLDAAMQSYERAQGKYDLAKHTHDALVADLKAAQKEAKGVPPVEVLVKVDEVLKRADRFNVKALEPVPKIKVTASFVEAARALDEADNLLAKVKTLDGLDVGHRCPTCTRTLDEKELKKLTTELSKSSEQAYQVAVKALRTELEAALGEVPFPKFKKVDEFDSWMSKNRRLLDTVNVTNNKLQLAAHRLAEATEALKATPEPKAPGDMSAQLDALVAQVSTHEAVVEAAQEAQSLAAQLAALGEASSSEKDLDDRISALRAKKQKLDEKYKSALDLKRDRDQAEATLKALKKQEAENEEKLQQHAKNVLLLKEYDDLLVPYFTTMRASKVTSCIGVLEGILPVYVTAMASDQYRGADVRLIVSDDLEQVDLQLKPSRFGPTVSALQASGGQRQRFMLAILAAIYESSARKANCLWLDEPFGHMESDGKALVTNRLLPMLMDRCSSLESIFVIAHDKEILESANDSFDSVWTVDRDEQGSRITIGQKLALVAGR